ncbi:(Fe-S)-binding protein [Methylovulum psychrotolerans]|nr:(Fe-S)-binding protein [Methylovulum psychrotolerans]
MMNELLSDADLCVKCGLCLPHCPTYTHTQNENESPRGRIALIQAWAGHKLPGSEALFAHIDNCLLCRACERACPAVVPYSRLIDNFRSHSHSHRSVRVALLKKVAHNQKTRRWAQTALRVYQSSHLQQTVRRLNLPKLLRLQSLERLLPSHSEPISPINSYYPATAPEQGQVGLFVGCLGEWLDQETVHAAITVLTAAGFAVHIPTTQACCGALALHDGDSTTARHLAATNIGSFSGLTLTAIVSIASGCGSQLRDYNNAGFAGKVMDISHFLSQFGAALTPRLKPLPKAVCLHSPCSLKNSLRTDQSVVNLLQKIPDLNLVPLPDSVQCCGSAGSYLLDHPQMAQTLLTAVLDQALAQPPDILVSSNIGCALHIAAGLRERGFTLEVVHPVVLLARQLTALGLEEDLTD